ncbi:hypothetical protein SODALDRAFT_320204 [Sodiomyces alkalinus F11]|uniref:SRR1-like domain-containing protein n=1 Tax=Sodiomyces alkalinus (strain CBS 110278 / VKM F-3762 / F11) TaxID=1314773 RepID=A0A3N2QAT2_SODAK|nr:hypothetical protein SODALDRAFT_320204 [Sodiomyces alkalinus F11]ROT43836.1 hypothetical protein SODALDRAFT_320204 [Sodiomyces alkalinus F11]
MGQCTLFSADTSKSDKAQSFSDSFALPSHNITKGNKTSGGKATKQIKRLEALYDETCSFYLQSNLSRSIATALDRKRRPRISKLVLLGLGSLGTSRDQGRRIKQLVLFVALALFITSTSEPKEASVSLYVQDPMFDRTDEAFLQNMGFKVLHTPSPYQLGEAGDVIDDETLVYTPHLPLMAYKALLASSTQGAGGGDGVKGGLEDAMPVLMSDDFDGLRRKWDKQTEEFRDVEMLTKRLRGYGYRRRAIGAGGFWVEEDASFPMALYTKVVKVV